MLGGLHPTSLPFEAADHADAVCIGPAESVWGQILDDCEHGRLQKFYRGRCEGSAALVPIPRRDLMNPRAYLLRHTMVTSRGCPHACDFCYKSSFWGPTYYEPRPIAEVERELSGIDDRLVFFLDDNLLANRRHARGAVRVLRGSGIVWQAAASLDMARDPQYLGEAYDAGCRSLFVGFESLSPENMRGNNKPVNAATDYAQACRRFHDAGIMINGSFVFGFDCDGPDVFNRTLEFTLENKILTASFHVLTPLPGTKAFERLEAQGRILHRNWTQYDTYHAVFQPRRMTPEQLEAGYDRAKREFAAWGSILGRSLGLPGRLEAARVQRGLDEDRPALGRHHPRRTDALRHADFRARSSPRHASRRTPIRRHAVRRNRGNRCSPAFLAKSHRGRGRAVPEGRSFIARGRGRAVPKGRSFIARGRGRAVPKGRSFIARGETPGNGGDQVLLALEGRS